MNINLIKYGQGHPVVFFHGWGFDSQIWHSLIPRLEDQMELILVDLPGFGQTPLMNWEVFKQQLITLLPDKFALVGWSMGGLYATRLALELPRKITKLFNVATSPRFIKDDNWSGVTEELFQLFYQNLMHDRQATLDEFISLQMPKKESPIYSGVLPSLEGLKAGLAILQAWDFRTQLVDLNMPVTYMFGRLDRIIHIDTLRVMQESYPKFNYVFFNKSAHMPFLSHPDLFIKELLEVLQ